MKTKHILFLTAFIPAIYGHAQVEFSGGLLGGINIGSVKIKHVDNAVEKTIEGKNIYGYETGLYGKLLANPFYVKSALLYNYRNGDLNYSTTSDGAITTTFSSHKIELPVLVGFHIIGPLNLEAGPVYNYIISVTEQYGSTDLSFGHNGLGYRAGAMAELGPITLGLSYSGALYNSGNGARIEEPSRIILGLGLRLGTTAKDE